MVLSILAFGVVDALLRHWTVKDAASIERMSEEYCSKMLTYTYSIIYCSVSNQINRFLFGVKTSAFPV